MGEWVESEPLPAQAGPAPHAAPTAPTAEELDTLARRLYPRVRDRLRADLRLHLDRTGHASGVA